MSEYVDVAGRQLKVGQRVAFCIAGESQNMRLGVVLRVLPKTVELDHPRKYGDSPFRRAHKSVCIAEDV